MLLAGINDFGGLSPLTRDYVNPESAWPHLTHLCTASAQRGKILLPRLAVYPSFLHEKDKWLCDQPVKFAVGASSVALLGPGFGDPGPLCTSPLTASLQASDASGLARAYSWYAGQAQEPGLNSEVMDSLSSNTVAHVAQPHPTTARSGEAPVVPRPRNRHWKVERGVLGAIVGSVSDSVPAPPVSAQVQSILARHASSEHAAEHTVHDTGWTVDDVVSLFTAYGSSAQAVVRQADELRKQRCCDGVSYVVNRSINYTNICTLPQSNLLVSGLLNDRQHSVIWSPYTHPLSCPCCADLHLRMCILCF